MSPVRYHAPRHPGFIAALTLMSLMLALDAGARVPVGRGDLDRGRLVLPLHRGAMVLFEQTVLATPGNCAGELILRIHWNRSTDSVELRLRGGPGSLAPRPDVNRTEGVDYRPNPFFPEPEDIQDGRYQLWIAGAAGPMVSFYHDGETQELLGSELDFEGAPVPGDAIATLLPTFYTIASPPFQPADDGSVDLQWRLRYAAAVRGDRPEHAHHILAFPPPDRAANDPFRLDQSWLRPYISAPRPASEARPWSDYLRGGLLLHVTVEPASYHVEPPAGTLVSTYSNATVVGGGIPRGWTLDLDAAFMGLTPPIRPWAGAAGGCTDHFAGVHAGAESP